MPRLQLSKATLTRERRNLTSYQRYLPALDMKQQQLRQALKACEQHREQRQQQLAQQLQRVASETPMLANTEVDLEGLVELVSVSTVEKRLAGVPVPAVDKIETTRLQWPLLDKPHWVSAVQQQLVEMLQQRVEIDVLEQQRQRLQQALRKVTQRVNLFEKVLIPEAQANIKRIEIYLDDRAREAVITAKIAKQNTHARLTGQDESSFSGEAR